jgi:hypothetical protein
LFPGNAVFAHPDACGSSSALGTLEAAGVNQVGSRAAEITDQLVYSVEYGGTPDDPSAHLA